MGAHGYFVGMPAMGALFHLGLADLSGGPLDIPGTHPPYTQGS